MSETSPALALPFDVEPATERRCYKCKVTRPIAMFYVELEQRRAAREGRTSSTYSWRMRRRASLVSRWQIRHGQRNLVKLEAGCADCGIRKPNPEIYDFDHLPGVEKIATISTFLTKGSWEDMLAEIDKCEVVCANCHRIRTRAREAGHFGSTRAAR